MPIALLVVLVVIAVVAGLYVGHLAGQQRQALEGRQAPTKTLGTRARDAASKGVVGLWRWNRARKKKARERE